MKRQHRRSAHQGFPFKRAWTLIVMVTALTLTPLLSAPVQSAPQWEALPGLDGRAEAIAFAPDGTLYAGGLFTGHVAAWDGVAWQTVGGTGPGIGSVKALAFDSTGNLYAGGSGDGGAAPFVAKWDGTTWSDITGYPPAAGVEALLFTRGLLYAGGSGSIANGYAASWDGTAWTALDQGPIEGTVRALAALSDGTILAGAADNVSDDVFSLSGTAWGALGTSPPGVNTIHSIAVGPGNEVYAGGQDPDFIVTYNGATSSWDSVSPAVADANLGSIRINALFVSADGTLYVGGRFGLVTGTQTLDYLGVLSSGSWSSPGTSFFVGGRIYDLVFAADGTLYVAGDFTGRVARLLDVPDVVDTSQIPPPVLQQVGRFGATCESVDDSSLNWGGAPSGGWTPSWAEWAVPSTGGPVCGRTLTYDPYLRRWRTS